MNTEGASSIPCGSPPKIVPVMHPLGSPPKSLPAMPTASADYYYLKAMEYLATSSESGAESSDGETDCACEKEEERFSFRPGLIRDIDGFKGGSSSSSSSGVSTQCNSPTCNGGGGGGGGAVGGAAGGVGQVGGEKDGRRRAASLGSHTVSTAAATAAARQRKLSIGSIAYGCATAGKGQDPSKVRRKLSDGHVHWADEFQKDLTRIHPRKSYSRHPSHCTPQVRPILKPKSDHDDDCLDEVDDDAEDENQC